MECRTFMMYAVHAMLFKFCPDSERNNVYNRDSLVEFLRVKYKEHYSTALRIDDHKCSGRTTIRETTELVPFENFNPRMTALQIGGEKLNIVLSGYDQFQMAFTDAMMMVSRDPR